MGEIFVCPDCNGKGKVYDHTTCLGTFGIGYLFGKEKCRRCAGTGFIEVG